MYVYRTIQGLKNYLHSKDKSIGFVPTMGALHAGHLALLNQSKKHSDISIVSIFVNPAQFNDAADLAKYPRDLNRDLGLLYDTQCDVVFAPDVNEIYPPGESTEPINLNGLDKRMEGVFRPGHFDGVARVMKRLLEIVEPQSLFMGQKDFQQTVIVRHVIKLNKMPVEFHTCPTIREPNGLAMSSRNELLSEDLQQHAAIIYETLKYCHEQIHHQPFAVLQDACLKKLSIPDFRPEYFEIVDGNTLEPAQNDSKFIVACCAVRAGTVRLIDNFVLRE